MRYYIADEKHPKGFVEVTEAEYNAIFGDETIRPYAQAVYRGDIAIEDVPIEHQDVVKTVVSNKVSRWGYMKTLKTRKVGTDEVYDEAVDVEGVPYTYEETDIPIEDYPEICG